jgi:hypothetical protein
MRCDRQKVEWHVVVLVVAVGGVGVGDVGGGWQGRVGRQQEVGMRHIKVTKRLEEIGDKEKLTAVPEPSSIEGNSPSFAQNTCEGSYRP